MWWAVYVRLLTHDEGLQDIHRLRLRLQEGVAHELGRAGVCREDTSLKVNNRLVPPSSPSYADILKILRNAVKAVQEPCPPVVIHPCHIHR